MQVYAKWEKNVTELTNSDTNVSISLTDGVPEDATLSADTIAQESVLGSRPELKEELPGLAVHLRHQRPPEWGNP